MTQSPKSWIINLVLNMAISLGSLVSLVHGALLDKSHTHMVVSFVDGEGFATLVLDG